MSEVRYYTVTQEREVKVTACSAVSAAMIGEDAFNLCSTCQTEKTTTKEKLYDVWGNATTPVRTRDLVVREDF
jgi:hypothetical protein